MSEITWDVTDPQFSADMICPEMAESAWSGHRNLQTPSIKSKSMVASSVSAIETGLAPTAICQAERGERQTGSCQSHVAQNTGTDQTAVGSQAAGRNELRIGFITERMRLGFGVDLVIDQTARGLMDRGYDVTVYTGFSDGTYHDAPYRLCDLSSSMFRNPIKSERAACENTEFFDNEPVDCYIIETFPYYSLIPHLQTRTIAVDHGISDSRGMNAKQRLRFLYNHLTQYGFYLRHSDRIVVISEFVKRTLPFWLRRRADVIYNGVDHYEVAPDVDAAAARAALGVPEDAVLWLYVGRLRHKDQPYKGTRELVHFYENARKRNSNIRLIMAGFGNSEDERHLRSRNVIPRVNVSAQTLATLYAVADLYTTCTRWEGFNLPALEAQRNGVPAIVYRCGAHPEVLDSSGAVLAEDSSEWLDAVVRISSDSALRERMRGYARANAERFSWKKAVDAYDRVIREVCG